MQQPSLEPEPWTLDHHLHHLVQTESRPGQPDTDGTRWAERQRTGKAMILCQCGWTTGMVDVAELPDIESLKAEHPNAWALASPTPNVQVTAST